MFSDNKDFYPTPRPLIKKMIEKIDKFYECKEILEPSAGAGHIVDYLKDEHSRYLDISVIEKDSRLQNLLVGSGARLIDTDFLSYSGNEQFDLIVANFPFSDGEKHLLKAIDVMYSGQIVCLLNAQTLKKESKTILERDLAWKLKDLNADIEYLEGEFEQAERKTKVEVALIYIDMRKEIENDFLSDLKEEQEEVIGLRDNFELTTKDTISSITKTFNREKELVINQILAFYKNYNLVSRHLTLKICDNKNDYSRDESLTGIMKSQINRFIRKLKKDYWLKTLELEEVKKYLSTKKKEEVKCKIDEFCNREFTEENIRQFILNLIQDFPKMINDAIEHLFDEFTKYALKDNGWREEECRKSVHYFNGWKTNDAFRANRKVIIPFYATNNWRNELEIDYKHRDFFHDLDVVMSYFEGEQPNLVSYRICENFVKIGQNRKIETPFFEISLFKKGTMHLKFRDEEIWRRFNIEACKNKNFLPFDYSEKPYDSLSEEEKELVNSFESRSTYKVIQAGNCIADKIKSNLPLLEMAGAGA